MRRFVATTKRCPRTGKISFRDEASAKRAMRNVASIDDGKGKPNRAYPCEFPECHAWHLTSEEERNDPRGNDRRRQRDARRDRRGHRAR